MIFAFTGSAGTQHGYEDGWSDDGVFNYFGEGQEGPMVFASGNKAIRDHVENGKELLLFEKVRRDGSVRYLGNFVCVGYRYQEAPDTNKQLRQAIVFQLLPIEDFEEGSLPNEANQKDSLTSLRERAYQSERNGDPVDSKEVKSKAFKRSSAVRSYALVRANGVCECCDSSAPFTTSGGEPFLEVHHILRLSDGGPDSPKRVAAVCPNCHRAVHYSSKNREINEFLLEKITRREANYEGGKP